MVIMKSAIVFGATGLIGRHVLLGLLDDPAYRSVTAVVRRQTGINHPKYRELLADLASLAKVKHALSADHVFCCLGTTRKKTPDLDTYYKIDHDYPVAAAEYTKANGATVFILASSVGADPGSSNYYLRIKGDTERDVLATGFESTHIFRPSLLTGDRQEKRALERLATLVFSAINPLLINGLTKYRSVPAERVARAMRAAAHQGSNGIGIYYWNDIKELG
jgi:Predicted nucleoside-diphosphate-sugar epimerases